MKSRGWRLAAIILVSFCAPAWGQQASPANPLPETPQPRQAPRPNPSDGVYHAGDGITQPTLLFSVEPAISEAARKIRGKRACTVYLVVDTDGHTSNVHVIAPKDKVRKQLDPHNCEPEAVAAVKEYRFKPATLQGKSVPFEMTIDLNYVIN